jgi:hypothetical protein
LAEIKRRPQKIPSIRRSLEYYMPLTLKLLKDYQHMESQKVQSLTSRATMEKIEGVLDVVNDAYRKQLDGLHREDSIDISSDIEVLQVMLAQDGLLSDDWKTG